MSSTSKNGILAVCATFLGLGVVTVGLRFYTRKAHKQLVRSDDYLAAVAMVAYIGAAICIFLLVSDHDLGYTHSSKTKEADENSNQLQISWDILNTLALACIKLSACFFYRRIFCFGGQRDWFDIATTVTAVIIVLWLIAFELLAGLQCGSHFAALWNPKEYLEYCTASFPYAYGVAISDFLLDVWILVLPIPKIWTLNATTGKKLSVVGIFLLAFVGLGASAARMAQFIQVVLEGPKYFLTHNQQRTLTQGIYLAMLESGMSLVAVNLPSLWVLLIAVKPEDWLRSVRSIISLHSMRTRASGSESIHSSYPPGTATSKSGATFSEAKRPSASSASSQPPVPPLPAVGDVEKQHHTYPMDDLEKGFTKI